jgi:peptidoglycan/LPS O-acetylase OafA/YrhL
VVGLNGVIAPTLAWDAPLWSLAFEVWFYVLAGALGYLIASRYKSKAAILVLTVCAAMFSVLAARYLLFWMLAGLMVFQLDTRRPGIQAALGASICAAGIIFFELGASSKSFTNVAIVPQAVAELLICAGFASTLPFLCGDALNGRIAFLARPAKWISSISFSLYLFHYPINEALSVILPPQATIDLKGMGLFGLRIAVCVGGSVIAYLLFERHTGAARGWCKNLLMKSAKASAAA